ncbi:MAG: HAMP domain-containing sensor histidine kinase [Gammaproteobacteria bacterium]
MQGLIITLKKNTVLILLICYLLCTISYAASPFSKPFAVGLTTFVGESGMDILIFALSLLGYRKADKKERRLLSVIATAFFCEIFADGFYNLIQNILNISNPSAVIASLYEIPLLAFLCLQASLWWRLFAEANVNMRKKRTPIHAYAPFITSSLLVIGIFVYFADWKIDRLSSEGLYQLADILVEAAGFALVSICLGTSKNKPLSCIAMGFLIIVFSNYMIRLPVLTLAAIQNSPFEFTWIGGQLLVFYGITHLNEDTSGKSSENWCYGADSLQSQIAVGSFGLGLLAIMLFSFFVKYATYSTLSDGNLLKYLLPVMIILSIITVILSSYFSKKLLRPLKELEDTIETYSLHEGFIDSKLNFHDDYGIREYVELKAFIKKALLSLSEKFTVEREISILAASVSHDIASPLAVMEMTISKYEKLFPLDAQSLLKDSIQRIRNIAHTLLERYRNPTNGIVPIMLNIRDNQIPCFVFLQHITEWAISQKYIEWTAHSCEVVLKNNLNINSGWLFIVPENLKRIISNLLNNAYEALRTKRKIEITIGAENNSFLYLLISDFGCGIAPEHLENVLHGKSLKHCGKGLGLSNAKAYIESMKGKILLTSHLNEGTQVKLLFPADLAPSWLPKNILLHSNSFVIVLDDENICPFWRNHLKALGINIRSFTHVSPLLTWCADHQEILNRAVYLFNYHLQDPLWTGLTLLEKLQAGPRGYLVTNTAEEISIQQRCVQLGIWLVPKKLIREIALKFNDS